MHPLTISESRPSQHSTDQATNKQSRFSFTRRLTSVNDSSCSSPLAAPQQLDEDVCDSSVLPWGILSSKVADLAQLQECSLETRLELRDMLGNRIRDHLSEVTNYSPYIEVKTINHYGKVDHSYEPLPHQETHEGASVEAFRIGVSSVDLPPYFYSSMINGSRIARGVVIDSLKSALFNWNSARQPKLALQLLSIDDLMPVHIENKEAAEDFSAVSSFLDAVLMLVPNNHTPPSQWKNVEHLKQFG